MLSPRKRPEVFLDTELPPLCGSGAELRLPLREPERVRVSVISFDRTCWRKLQIRTAEVVDGNVVMELGDGESQGSKRRQYERLIWTWFSHFESRPMPSGSCHLVAFEPASNDSERSSKERWCIEMATEMLNKFENTHVVPWEQNAAVFWEVCGSCFYPNNCRDSRPELPWEVDDCSDESI